MIATELIYAQPAGDEALPRVASVAGADNGVGVCVVLLGQGAFPIDDAEIQRANSNHILGAWQ